ncbi:hypothetical protein HWV62_33841 [Athelia sp. TMB]|nr:hypothetical protein HWV62_33841 [Athelia sp. TMB]
MLKYLALSAVLAGKALAHGGVLSYSNAGNWYWGWQPYNSPTGQTTIQRPWSSYNPITDATDPQLACNDDGTAGALQLTATVAAGSAITAYWNQVWPHPYGPMFKIDQSGLINGTVYDGVWGDGVMIAQNSSWTTTIPKTVPSGNYFIRFETIALHSLPAQFYPECAQITITGGGSLAPTAAQLVTFPGGYSNSDPGLTIDIYSNAAQTQTTYPIPGPPLYGSSGGSGTTPPTSGTTSSTTSKTSTSPTSVSKTSTSTSPITSPTTVGTVPEYGQCGGNGWTGATACVSPFKCTVSNAYYSQCL